MVDQSDLNLPIWTELRLTLLSLFFTATYPLEHYRYYNHVTSLTLRIKDVSRL